MGYIGCILWGSIKLVTAIIMLPIFVVMSGIELTAFIGGAKEWGALTDWYGQLFKHNKRRKP